jgi:hypothetical protein
VLVRNVAILGVGLGAAMPVFNLAVQNAVEARIVGAATSMVQFVRSIGGALGIAVFGSVLANGFSPSFREALPADVLCKVSPARLDVLADAQLYMTSAGTKQLDGILTGFGLNSDVVMGAVRQAARTALATSLHDVFQIAAALGYRQSGLREAVAGLSCRPPKRLAPTVVRFQWASLGRCPIRFEDTGDYTGVFTSARRAALTFVISSPLEEPTLDHHKQHIDGVSDKPNSERSNKHIGNSEVRSCVVDHIS